MSTVEEIVNAIKDLPPDERDEVRRRLVRLWSARSPEQATGRDKPGSLDKIQWITTDRELKTKRDRPRRPPIKIKGKPISQTVIEDRR
jgi:hypothetical protein